MSSSLKDIAKGFTTTVLNLVNMLVQYQSVIFSYCRINI